MSGRRSKTLIVMTVLCSTAVALGACGGSTAMSGGTSLGRAPASSTTAPTVAPTTTPGPSSTQGPYWLVEDFTLALLERNGLPVATISKVFNSPRTLLIVRPRGSVPDSLVPQATKVQSFASLTAMQAAIESGTVEPGVRYLLYDNEAWSFTPDNEKQAPFTYAAQAESLAHAHGYQLIFTPAANLSPILSSSYTTSNQLGSRTDKYSGYLNLDMAGKGAAASDIFEIQGQQAEESPAFASFVQQAVGQARAAAPDHPVLLGITTSVQGGGGVSAASLSNVVAQTRSAVDGYWLNVPQASAQCPVCGAADVGSAVSFLESYAAGTGG